jgi:hypothetical protein
MSLKRCLSGMRVGLTERLASMKIYRVWNARYCAWAHERLSYQGTDDEFEHIFRVGCFVARAMITNIEREVKK